MHTGLLSKPQTRCLGCRLDQGLAAFPQERVKFTSSVTDLSSVGAGGWEEPHVGEGRHEDFTGHPSTLRPNDHPVLRCTQLSNSPGHHPRNLTATRAPHLVCGGELQTGVFLFRC